MSQECAELDVYKNSGSDMNYIHVACLTHTKHKISNDDQTQYS